MARSIDPPWWWKPWIGPAAALKAWRGRERPLRCMPRPLALLCWLDNRSHARQPWDAPAGLLCHVHDLALHGWCWVRIRVGPA